MPLPKRGWWSMVLQKKKQRWQWLAFVPLVMCWVRWMMDGSPCWPGGRGPGPLDQRSSGVLNLIDLAGSERLNASGVTGDRLKVPATLAF